MVIQIVHSRNKRIILCSDWNLNFMQDYIRLQEVENLLEDYNLINTLRSQTRITSSTESLIDCIVTHNQE